MMAELWDILFKLVFSQLNWIDEAMKLLGERIRRMMIGAETAQIRPLDDL